MNAVDELNLLLGIGPPRPQLPLTLRKSGYSSVRALGKGSYGQAFLVFHDGRKQYYVVKHLNMASMTGRQRRDAHNEIMILQQLHHPNIVRYVEYFEERSQLYIVMEYADGGDVYTLLDRIKKSQHGHIPPSHSAPSSSSTAPLTETQVVSLFVQTTMAVKYMHGRRLLHRDIKSSNIFLTQNHVVKLGDFGISTVLQSTMAMASTMCGTPCYFSPELCLGRPYNSKSDMWALGVLLYELCSGHLPFEATTMKALMKEIVHQEPRRIPDIFSDELWALTQALLQKEPRKRPDAAQVLLTPVLMRCVPELMQQLSAIEAEGGGHQNQQIALGMPPPASQPSSSPRGKPTSQKEQRSSAVPSPAEEKDINAAAAAAAAAAASRRRASSSVAGAGGSAEKNAMKSGSDKVSSNCAAGKERPSAASIPELLARFDAQKRRWSEEKEKTQSNRTDPTGSATRGSPHAPPSTPDKEVVPGPPPPPRGVASPTSPPRSGVAKAGGSAADPSPKSGVPPQLSPGAAAALQQQGLLPPSSSSAAASPKPSHLYTPPPLPAALRTGMATDADPAPSARDGDSGNGEALAPNSNVAKASSVDLMAPSELSAMLTELFTWRERSIQRHQHNNISSHGSAAAAAKDKKTPGPTSEPPAPPAGAGATTVGSTRQGKGETTGLPVPKAGPSQGSARRSAPESVSAHPVAEEAEEFEDPLGATLDVHSLQAADDHRLSTVDASVEKFAAGDSAALLSPSSRRLQQPNAMIPASLTTSRHSHHWKAGSSAATTSTSASTSPRNVIAASMRQTMHKTFTETMEKAQEIQRATLSRASLRVPLNAAGDGTEEADCEDDFFHFTAWCLCRQAHMRGGLSSIYGSFMCHCGVCRRAGGSNVGVEWLHLPEVQSVLDLLAQRGCAASVSESPAGAGVTAAAALRRASAPSSPVAKKDMSSALGKAGLRCFVHHSEEMDCDEEDEDAEAAAEQGPLGKPNPQNFYIAEHHLFFCTTCGALMGVQHDGVEGLLVPKVALNSQSRAILDSCAQTMVSGENLSK